MRRDARGWSQAEKSHGTAPQALKVINRSMIPATPTKKPEWPEENGKNSPPARHRGYNRGYCELDRRQTQPDVKRQLILLQKGRRIDNVLLLGRFCRRIFTNKNLRRSSNGRPVFAGHELLRSA